MTATAITLIPDSVPVTLLAAISVAERDCVPGVIRVVAKLWVPALEAAKVNWAGKTALPSLLPKVTVPVYPVAALP